MTREEWLVAASAEVREIVALAAGNPVPRLYVSVGFPKGARAGRGRRAVGQCWDGSASRDGAPHIFVCPSLEPPLDVLAVLLHEQVHAAVGTKEKHRGRFAATMRACGMVKPWTGSTPSPELRTRLEAVAAALGPYPHAALTPRDVERRGSRLRLWECGCPVKVRVASDDFQARCLTCGTPFKRRK